MTTITFTLDQNNNLVGIDNATGFPSTIPLTVDGLKKVQTILHATDEAMRQQYYERYQIVLGERKQAQLTELEELF